MATFNAEFLSDYHAIMLNVGDLIKSSEKFICIVTPYMNWTDELYRVLKVAKSKEIPVLIILRDPANQQYNNNSLIKELSLFPNIALYYCKDLHAKIYLNEKVAILPSKNLYERKDNNCSIEVGIKISSSNGIFEILKSIAELKTSMPQSPILTSDTACKFFNILLKPKKFAESTTLNSLLRKCFEIENKKQEKVGFCIRCGKEIPFSTNAPLCLECWKSWQTYSDYSSRENYCHGCKAKSEYKNPIQFSNPLCQKCLESKI